MLDELNSAISDYQSKWSRLVGARTDKAFFEKLKPTAVGWKVADMGEYERIRTELHDQSARIIETWMNGRWVAKFQLRDAGLAGGIRIIKILQRRPGSDDALGLDHLDFHSPALVEVDKILEKESGLKWTHEDNDIVSGYDWVSIWFDGTEAKLKPGTVFNIIQKELEEANQSIIDSK